MFGASFVRRSLSSQRRRSAVVISSTRRAPELGHEPHVEMALVEVDARLRAAAALVGVADERAEMVEELVAELRHGRRGGADAELAAVAVGREAAGLGDGLGLRGRGEPPA